MTKRARRVGVGQILDKQDSVKTYNESQEGLIYNNQDLGIRTQIEGADREVLTDTQTQAVQNKSLDNTNSVVLKDDALTIQDPADATKQARLDAGSVTPGQTRVLASPDASGEILLKDNTVAVTAKTIDADSNTISNLETDNLKSGVLNTSLSGGATDVQVPSAKAAKDYADSVSGAVNTALGNHLSDTVDAHLGTAIGNTPSGNLSATTVQAALNELQSDVDTREVAANKGAANGYCPLGADQKVPAANLPSYVDDVLEYANLAAFPVTGEANKIYIAIDTNLTYRWTGSVYAEISQSLALGETSTTAYRGDRGKTAYDHSQTTSGSHGITGSFVGTNDTQALTNKDYQGGTASDTSRLTLPTNTLSNLNGLTRKEGTIVYATDTDKVYYDDGTNLTAVGSGSGSGSLATYAQLKSDDDTGTWSTGNNATFLGGGSIAGTFTKQNATNPLNGTYSYTLVQAAGSLNDYVASDVQAVPLRSRGVTNSTDLVYTYDGSDNDIKWIVYDVTNAAVVTPVTAYVKASSVGKTAQLVYDLPVTCTQVRFGAQVVVANNGKTLKFDDVQLATWTPQAVNLVETQVTRQNWQTANSYSSNLILFASQVGGWSYKSGSGIYTDSVVSSHTRFNILKKALFTGSFANTNTLDYRPIVYLNGSQVSGGTVSKVTGAEAQVAFSFEVKAGDYVEFGSGSPNSTYAELNITATAISDNVVQSWQDGTEWTSYTPTFSAGFGTVTNASGKWKRSGSDLEVFVSCTTGTVAASLATVSLPSGLSIDSSKLTINNTTSNPGNLVGTYNSSDAAVGGVGNVVLAPATSTSLFYFGSLDAGASSHITPTTVNGVVSASKVFSFYAKVPIQGWSSSPTLLALPTSKENRFDGEFSSSGLIQQPNNTVLGNAVVSDTSLYTIPLQSGVFTTAPNVTASLNYNQPIGSGVGTIGVVSISTTQIVVRTGYVDSNGYNVRYAIPFTLYVSKKSPDYTAPGVHVGSLSGQWQYDISSYVTSSPAVSSMTRAVAVVTKCDSGQYRMKFNISYTVASGSRTGATATIANCTFKNISGFSQPCSGLNSNSLPNVCYTTPNTGNINQDHTTATTTAYYFSGDVELESRPTWATQTS